ncbi:MAG TPA: flagellar protein FlaG [Marinagarivorans sp.]
MNEISVIRPNPMPVAKASVAPEQAAADGKDLPVARGVGQAEPVKGNRAVDDAEGVNATSDVKADRQAAAKALEEAVETANEFVQTVQRDLHFSIDDETERTVVKVVESSSGEVIRQIPDETFLELARKMKEHGQVNLVDATG